MKRYISYELNFPSLPSIVSECLSQLYETEVDFDRISQLASKDVALVVRILRLANSAMYSSGKTTSDLKTAMIRIGLTSVIQILVSQTIEHIFPFEPIGFFNMTSYLEHSSSVSQIAFGIGKLTLSDNSPDILIAGLLHDIGQLARIYIDRPLAQEIIEKCERDNTDIKTAEQQLNAEEHNVIGEYLLEKWNMPKNVISIVRYHDVPQKERPQTLSFEQNKCIDIISISDIVAHRFKKSYINYKRKTYVDKYDLDKIGIVSSDIENIIKSLSNHS